MKDKNRRAVALKYDSTTGDAPVVMAKGSGHIADKILQIAHQHDVPVTVNPWVTDALVHLELGEEVPPEMYKAVAEILAFIYRLDSQKTRES